MFVSMWNFCLLMLKTCTLVRLERRLDDSEKRKVRDGGSRSKRGKKGWSQSEEWKRLRKLQKKKIFGLFHTESYL